VPFTGLDIALMLAGGVVLVGGGALLGRLVRRAPDGP